MLGQDPDGAKDSTDDRHDERLSSLSETDARKCIRT